MPKSVEYIVDDFNDRLRRANVEVGTILWSDIYNDYEITRWKPERAEQIMARAMEKYGLNVSFTHAVVTITTNRNFSPI
ncbi:hypothetical protein [Rhizobium laguerreae]|uniref:hypothetical protein n=1 Tax=Rhizobium laguerreae TaxID=1076926 RepID=UPI001441E949|nr:hypothetical protein [Rhizobium laguerreae]NKM30093.1 hypothetical protein [Rhizobium laguerreae]